MEHKVKNYNCGDSIQWKWMGRIVSGNVKEVYLKPVVKLIKSKTIKRNGSVENPAYLVESKAGNLALKLHTELIYERTEKSINSKLKPTMFDDK